MSFQITNTTGNSRSPQGSSPVKPRTAANSVNSIAMPASTTMLESIARHNNVGVACLSADDDRQQLSEAGNALKRALEKANAMTFFSASAGSVASRHNKSEEVSKNLYIYQRGEYDEGMHTFSIPLPLDDLNDLGMHAVTATILFNLGQLYLRLNEEQEATDSFLQALQLMHMGSQPNLPVCLSGGKKGEAPQTISFMALYHNLGHLQYRQGHYEDAVRTYSKALEVGRATTHPTSHQLLELAATLNCLGVLCFHLPQADTEQAMNLYQESLQLRYAVLGRDAQTKEIATTLNNIGRVHYMKGHHAAALEWYQRALSMRRHLLGDDHLDVAATIYNAGQTHHQRGQLGEAMRLYEEFLRIAQQRLGVYHRDVATMLKCMAQIHHEQKEYGPAAELYEQALRVGKAALGDYHPEVASTLNKLGNLHYERGDMDSALRVYQEGLLVERAVLDTYHPNIVVTLTNIGQIHKLRGEHQAALRLYKEAVSVQRHALGASHPNIATTLSSIALIHYQTRAYTKALDVYQEALRIRRDAFGDVHLDVASTLNSLGLVLFKMQLHDFALQSFRESLRIRRDLLGNDHREVAIILYNVATILLETGDDEEALVFYRETLRVERTALGETHNDVIATTLHLGQVHQQRGELTEALEYFEHALKIQQEQCSPENAAQMAVSMATTLNHIGNVHLQRGDARSLVQAFAGAVRCLKVAGKNEQDLAISGFNFYGLSKMHPECAPLA